MTTHFFPALIFSGPVTPEKAFGALRIDEAKRDQVLKDFEQSGQSVLSVAHYPNQHSDQLPALHLVLVSQPDGPAAYMCMGYREARFPTAAAAMSAVSMYPGPAWLALEHTELEGPVN